MKVTYSCPGCKAGNTQEVSGQDSLVCAGCGGRIEPPPDAIEEGSLRRCLACPSTDLFNRKDFSQKLGVGIVILGFAASCVAWNYHWIYTTFGILFATAFIDVALYALVGDVLVCYRCQAEYRDLDGMREHGAFELETHERYRQEAARLADIPAKGAQLLKR